MVTWNTQILCRYRSIISNIYRNSTMMSSTSRKVRNIPRNSDFYMQTEYNLLEFLELANATI